MFGEGDNREVVVLEVFKSEIVFNLRLVQTKLHSMTNRYTPNDFRLLVERLERKIGTRCYA